MGGSFARMCMPDCPPISEAKLFVMGLVIVGAALIVGLICKHFDIR